MNVQVDLWQMPVFVMVVDVQITQMSNGMIAVQCFTACHPAIYDLACAYGDNAVGVCVKAVDF